MPRSFVLRTPTGNIVMEEATYSTEALFQEMLTNTNEVLSGDQINPTVPRRWLLVSPEMPIPDSDGGSNRWSLDHLFLDQDGIPTLIEIKRSTDTRIRREVVGQMLDYAANAVVHWPVEIIRERLAAAWSAKQRSVDEVLTEFLQLNSNDESALDDFWERVKLNLRAGKVRMIFVADSIPPELQRIIEFLNEQMNPAEVLGLEVRVHSGKGGYELLVPSLIGRTAEAQAVKASSASQRRQWDEGAYYSDLTEKLGERAAQTVEAIANWMNQNEVHAQYSGQGKTYGSLVAIFRHNGVDHRPFVIYGDGSVEIRFNHMKEKGVFAVREKRLDLLHRLNAIDGVRLPESKIDSRPNFRLDSLYNPASLSSFLRVWEWYLNEIQFES